MRRRRVVKRKSFVFLIYEDDSGKLGVTRDPSTNCSHNPEDYSERKIRRILGTKKIFVGTLYYHRYGSLLEGPAIMPKNSAAGINAWVNKRDELGRLLMELESKIKMKLNSKIKK